MDQRLRERVRPLNDAVPPRHGEFVLYWCATALRAEENPALEVAIAEANARRLPALAWQGLTCTERYASDRGFRFVLEGVPGLARDLAARGVRHVFHLERGPEDPGLPCSISRAGPASSSPRTSPPATWHARGNGSPHRPGSPCSRWTRPASCPCVSSGRRTSERSPFAMRPPRPDSSGSGRRCRGSTRTGPRSTATSDSPPRPWTRPVSRICSPPAPSTTVSGPFSTRRGERPRRVVAGRASGSTGSATPPVPQTLELVSRGGLLARLPADLRDALETVRHRPAFVLLLRLAERCPRLPASGVLSVRDGGCVSRIVENARGTGPSRLSVYARETWATEELDSPLEGVAATLATAAACALGFDPADVLGIRG